MIYVGEKVIGTANTTLAYCVLSSLKEMLNFGSPTEISKMQCIFCPNPSIWNSFEDTGADLNMGCTMETV